MKKIVVLTFFSALLVFMTSAVYAQIGIKVGATLDRKSVV